MAKMQTAAEIRAGKSEKPAKKKPRGGSRKGIPNLRTKELMQRIDGLCCDGKDDPVEFLIKVMHRKYAANMDQRVEAAKTLIQYQYPKRKAVDFEPPGKNEDYTKQGQDLAALLFAVDLKGHQVSLTAAQIQELQATGAITMENGLKLMQQQP